MTFIDIDEPPDCGGLAREHVDGTTSDCSRRARCTGGEHTQAEACDPDGCDYCQTLRCPHELVEHINGVEQCRERGEACPGVWHDGGFLDCTEVDGDDHLCPPLSGLHTPAVTWSLPSGR